MDFIKEWTFAVCVTLVASVLISLLLPSGTMGKYSKMIVSVFIFVSLLLPLTKGEISFALPDMDIEEYQQEQDNTYSKLIASEAEKLLSDEGYTGITVSCDAEINDNEEIEVRKIKAYIPDEYTKEEVKSFLYDNLGMAAEVYYIGE